MAKKEIKKEIITKEMTFGEVLRKYPGTAGVFMKHGMHCIGCAMASMEPIEQGAAVHGMDADELVKDLNKVTAKKK